MKKLFIIIVIFPFSSYTMRREHSQEFHTQKEIKKQLGSLIKDHVKREPLCLFSSATCCIGAALSYCAWGWLRNTLVENNCNLVQEVNDAGWGLCFGWCCMMCGAVATVPSVVRLCKKCCQEVNQEEKIA